MSQKDTIPKTVNKFYKNKVKIDFDDLERQESLCSSCKNEIATLDNAQNEEVLTKNASDLTDIAINKIFSEGLNVAEELSRATRSLSKISLDYPNTDAIYYNGTNQEHDYFLNGNDNQNGENFCTSLFNEDEFNVAELNEQALVSREYDCNGNDLPDTNFTEQPDFILKPQFSDKEVQTDMNSEIKKNEHMWDPEFPSESELEQIDLAISKTKTTNICKYKRKLPLEQGTDCHGQIKKKSKEIHKPHYNAMVSIKLNREKKLADLSNDIFVLSSYLDDVRKALNVKERNVSIKVPSPPMLTGYDSQFESLNHNRFSKLPIMVSSVDSNKTNDTYESVNHSKQRIHTDLSSKSAKEKNPNGTLTYKSVKRLNNKQNKNVNISYKKVYQSTIKEAFNYGKENQGDKKTNHGFKTLSEYINSSKNLNPTNINSAVEQTDEEKSLDSTLMYEFNPLRFSKTTKEK